MILSRLGDRTLRLLLGRLARRNHRCCSCGAVYWKVDVLNCIILYPYFFFFFSYGVFGVFITVKESSQCNARFLTLHATSIFQTK